MNLHQINMKSKSAVFLDANVLIYALDMTSEQHGEVVFLIQSFLNESEIICT